MGVRSFKDKDLCVFQGCFETEFHVNLKGLLCSLASISKFHVHVIRLNRQLEINYNKTGFYLFLMNMQVFGTITFPCGEKRPR